MLPGAHVARERSARACAGWLAVLVLLAPACRDEPQLAPPPDRSDRVALSLAGRSVALELALTPDEHKRGLMHRTELGADAGMLFVYRTGAARTFWMRNTLIPLDIVFIDEGGKVLNVAEAPQAVEKPPFTSRGLARAVIELNRGWCAAHGLAPGDRVVIPADVLARALLD